MEEQSLFLRLPCKEGDTIWELCECDDNVHRTFPMTVKQVVPWGSVRWIKEEPTIWNIYATSDYTDMYKSFYDFGKTIFLTQAEAEEKLRDLKGKRKLKDCEPGSTVTIAGEQWQVLEHLKNGGTFCIKKDLLGVKRYRAFDTNNCNNWKKSSLRVYLNGEYLEDLLEKLQDDNNIILNTTQDLTTDDGLKDYGYSTDKVTLLTCNQYRQYRHLFDKIDDWWWLITADSTTNCDARLVYTDGSLSYGTAYRGFYGVRPACTFNSFVEVE